MFIRQSRFSATSRERELNGTSRSVITHLKVRPLVLFQTAEFRFHCARVMSIELTSLFRPLWGLRYFGLT